jgi:hypothetical protein
MSKMVRLEKSNSGSTLGAKLAVERRKVDASFRKRRVPMDFAGIRRSVPLSTPKGLRQVHVVSANYTGSRETPHFHPNEGCIAVDPKRDIVWLTQGVDSEGRYGNIEVIGLLIEPGKHPLMPKARITRVWSFKEEVKEEDGVAKLSEVEEVEGAVRVLSDAFHLVSGAFYFWGDPLIGLTPKERGPEDSWPPSREIEAGRQRGIKRIDKLFGKTPTAIFVRQLVSLIGSYVSG